MDALKEIRFAVRNAANSPRLTLTIVATLGLCIGANSAVFSFVDAALLRSLPYPEPDRLWQVAVFTQTSQETSERLGHDGSSWNAFSDAVDTLDLAVFSNQASGVNFSSGRDVSVVQAQRVSAGFFRVLGVAPRLGREFSEDDDRPGGSAVVVVSHSLWQRAWNEDPSILGESALVRGEPHVVVGVMPHGFRSSVNADIWTPLRASTLGEGAGLNYEIVGRLRQSVALTEADAEIIAVGQALLDAKPPRQGVSARYGVVGLQHGLTRGLRAPLLVLWATVGVVLIVGCVNVGSMLVARSAARAREIGIRRALGARSVTIIRQLLFESLIYAILGGAAGVGVGRLVLIWLRSMAEQTFAVHDVSLDARSLLVTAGLSVLSVTMFGLLPALQTSTADVRSALGGGGVTGSGSRQRRLGTMVAGQVALAVALLLVAVLLTRSFVHLSRLQPGFDAVNVSAATLSLHDARYNTPEEVETLFRRVLLRLEQIPAVESAGVGLSLPYERGLNFPFRVVGLDSDRESLTSLSYVSRRYFETLRIALVQGRVFQDSDELNRKRVVVVNRAFAQRYLEDVEPLGAQLRMADASWEIVGIVSDVQQRPSWGTAAPLDTVPTAYVAAAQTNTDFLALVHTWFAPSIVIRTKAGSADLRSEVRNAVASADPLLPVASFRTLGDVKQSSIAREELMATLLTFFAALAAIIAAVGIHGMVASAVAARTKELSIRIAVGATSARVAALAITPGLARVAVGAAIGCVLALLSARGLEHLIWGVRPTDPVAFAVVCAVTLSLAVAASVGPAARILRLSVTENLRDD